ncbi:uncharacterized protein CTRU02_209599 [Colletotrichum truncatum]|uniref:Uncharacterized protein n=1 Tax=Colletotrichum truncatum TaxID=5467 RepID=A0ACC3YSW7_COLTU|nr:uncharacterized protein CTRU02_12098 [Colletotrichum truncatum]KAF6785166.1 hypothetical protein CTRU02_12098 [Colletotrichum truncatum]
MSGESPEGHRPDNGHGGDFNESPLDYISGQGLGRSPSPYSCSERTVPTQVAGPDEEGQLSDDHNIVLDSDAAKENERQVLEQAGIELETQELEAHWRRRLHTETPVPAQPSLVIGAPLGKNLTAAEAARRLVSQWEAIYKATVSETPEGAASVLESLDEARAQLASFQSSDGGSSFGEISTPLNSLAEHKLNSVSSRIQVLESALLESTFPPERANISAAISFYRNSSIPYSSNWALVYAGNLVDFAPTYASFTSDRAERLDRYSRMYGEGWLWFEPPLARESAPIFSARRGTWLPETDTSFDMGHYSVAMSFRRMKNLAYHGTNSSRKRRRSEISDEDEIDWPLSSAETDSESSLSPTARPSRKRAQEKAPPTQLRESRPTRHPHMTTDPAAPVLHFSMLLDSGATLPMLYHHDMLALGINPNQYAAVSCITVETAADKLITSWIYEMQVAIADTNTCSSLVSPTSPVWPAEEHYLGGIVPVMVKPLPKPGKGPAFSTSSGKTSAIAQTVGDHTTFLETATSVIDTAEGRDYGRLSGLLPFKCCYVQSTPGLKAIWLGEDRRDVLGAHRMPGQMRWAPGSNRTCDPGQPRDLWKDICGQGDEGKPVLLRMAHENVASGSGGRGKDPVRMVDVEEKGWKGRSEILVVDGNGVRTKHVIEPKSLHGQGVKRRKLNR